jgi:hypothetical protein
MEVLAASIFTSNPRTVKLFQKIGCILYGNSGFGNGLGKTVGKGCGVDWTYDLPHSRTERNTRRKES